MTAYHEVLMKLAKCLLPLMDLAMRLLPLIWPCTIVHTTLEIVDNVFTTFGGLYKVFTFNA